MKRINVYVITYNNSERINQNIDCFFDTTKNIDKTRFDIKYHVINNHTKFSLSAENSERVVILHNSLRPNFSCGHLSRDYNAALIHGFENLKTPKVDQVICAHDDSMWNEHWFETLLEIHETYTFYAGNYGCSLTSYLPDAVRKIGIWDERFAGIGYHEADYFLRAFIYNSDKSSINDDFGGRVLNPTKNLFTHAVPNSDKDSHVNSSLPFHTVSRNVFEKKWKVHPEDWKTRLFRENIPKSPQIETYMFYPYFECDIENLDEKKYCYWPIGLENFKSEWR